MTQPARRAPVVFAGVLAMMASVAGLAAIIIADVAEASDERALHDSDELGVPSPVVMAKLKVRSMESVTRAIMEVLEAPELDSIDEDLDDDDEPRPRNKKSKKRINFGRFEGY